MCLQFDNAFNTLRDAATSLTPFAAATRYPGDLVDISDQEARKALAQAPQIWDFILARLPGQTQNTKK
jgi:hypothetical protein